jgi:hypothetical protein
LQATIDFIRTRSISIAPQQLQHLTARRSSAAPGEARMEHEQVTRIPQTTMATQKTSAAPADDLHRLIRVRQAWIDGHQAINAEMLAFWQSRLKAGLAAGGQLLECTSVDSVLEVQLDYAKAALQAYLDQSSRIAGLVMRALSAGFLPEPPAAVSNGQARALAA